MNEKSEPLNPKTGKPLAPKSRGRLHPSGGPGKGPARGYKWKPLEPGHTLSLRHGARSPRTYQPIAQALVQAVLEERPDLAGYGHAVVAWAEAEARAELMRAYVGGVGMIGPDGEPRSGTLHWLLQFERRAEAGRAKLGLDPRSHAELLRERVEVQRSSMDLDSVRARGAEILEGRAEGAE